MARKSLASRMDRVMDALLPVGTMAHREYYLPSHLQEALRIHRTKVDSIISRLEKIAPGASYEALIDGTLDTPQMPVALRDALDLPPPPTITEDTTVSDAAQAWAQFALGDDR